MQTIAEPSTDLFLIVTDPYPLPVQWSSGDIYKIEFDIMERPFVRDKVDKDEIYYVEDLVYRHVTFEIKKHI